MKKVLFGMLLIGSAVTVSAQKQKLVKFDKDKMTNYFTTGKYVDAKDYVSNVLQNPKDPGNKEPLVCEAFIYSQLGYDSATSAAYPLAIDTANNILDSLQKTTDTATFNKLMRSTIYTTNRGFTQIGVSAVSIVYATAFNVGKNQFQNQQWDSAYHSFYRAAHWANYITQNGFSQNPNRNAIDTFTVLYTGFAAQNAAGFDPETGFKNPVMADSAMSIYTALADRNIAMPSMEAMYVFMVEYYQYKKDKPNADKYLAMGKQYYPDKADMWSQLEMQGITEGGDVNEIIKNYQASDAAGTMTDDQYAQIAGTLYNMEKKIQDSATFVTVNNTAIDAYQKAFAKNQNGLYAYNVGILYYNVFNKLDDEFYANTGQEAAKKAKRDAIVQRQQPVADSAIYWFNQAYTILSAKTNRDERENTTGNNAIKSLTSLYGWKASKAQGYNAADFTKYDGLSSQFGKLEDTFK